MLPVFSLTNRGADKSSHNSRDSTSETSRYVSIGGKCAEVSSWFLWKKMGSTHCCATMRNLSSNFVGKRTLISWYLLQQLQSSSNDVVLLDSFRCPSSMQYQGMSDNVLFARFCILPAAICVHHLCQSSVYLLCVHLLCFLANNDAAGLKGHFHRFRYPVQSSLVNHSGLEESAWATDSPRIHQNNMQV